MRRETKKHTFIQLFYNLNLETHLNKEMQQKNTWKNRSQHIMNLRRLDNGILETWLIGWGRENTEGKNIYNNFRVCVCVCGVYDGNGGCMFVRCAALYSVERSSDLLLRRERFQVFGEFDNFNPTKPMCHTCASEVMLHCQSPHLLTSNTTHDLLCNLLRHTHTREL